MLGILDHGAGNLSSVGFALERLGLEHVLVSEPGQAGALDGLIFPGVGRARSAVERLRSSGLWDLLLGWKKPLLGICLGMQLLFEHCEEDDCPGLGLLQGTVRLLQPGDLKVPHMGWNQVRPVGRSFLGDPGDPPGWFYFVHSYAVADSPAACGLTEYGGSFVAAVDSGPIWGVQFHPERSGPAGARLLQRFVARTQLWPEPR